MTSTKWDRTYGWDQLSGLASSRLQEKMYYGVPMDASEVDTINRSPCTVLQSPESIDGDDLFFTGRIVDTCLSSPKMAAGVGPRGGA